LLVQQNRDAVCNVVSVDEHSVQTSWKWPRFISKFGSVLDGVKGAMLTMEQILLYFGDIRMIIKSTWEEMECDLVMST
jgi:hypothetical protein